MWSLYARSGQGIAIKTSFQRFKNAFSRASIDVSAGMVRYVDYDTHNVDITNFFNLGIIKRRSFEHEKELRAMIMDPSDNPGVYVDVDLQELVQYIVVSPGSPSWFCDVVRRQAENSRLGDRVSKSMLLDHPEYLVSFLRSGYGA